MLQGCLACTPRHPRPSGQPAKPLQAMQAQRRSCRPILREKWGTWTPRLLMSKAKHARPSSGEFWQLRSLSCVRWCGLWALGHYGVGPKPHFGTLCACLVAATRSWPLSRSAAGQAPTHCVGSAKACKLSSGLMCVACSLQPVGMGLTLTGHQSACVSTRARCCCEAVTVVIAVWLQYSTRGAAGAGRGACQGTCTGVRRAHEQLCRRRTLQGCLACTPRRPTPSGQPAEASAGYASTALKFQADLKYKLGDLVPPRVH